MLHFIIVPADGLMELSCMRYLHLVSFTLMITLLYIPCDISKTRLVLVDCLLVCLLVCLLLVEEAWSSG